MSAEPTTSVKPVEAVEAVEVVAPEKIGEQGQSAQNGPCVFNKDKMAQAKDQFAWFGKECDTVKWIILPEFDQEEGDLRVALDESLIVNKVILHLLRTVPGIEGTVANKLLGEVGSQKRTDILNSFEAKSLELIAQCPASSSEEYDFDVARELGELNFAFVSVFCSNQNEFKDLISTFKDRRHPDIQVLQDEIKSLTLTGNSDIADTIKVPDHTPLVNLTDDEIFAFLRLAMVPLAGLVNKEIHTNKKDSTYWKEAFDAVASSMDIRYCNVELEFPFRFMGCKCPKTNQCTIEAWTCSSTWIQRMFVLTHSAALAERLRTAGDEVMAIQINDDKELKELIKAAQICLGLDEEEDLPHTTEELASMILGLIKWNTPASLDTIAELQKIVDARQERANEAASAQIAALVEAHGLPRPPTDKPIANADEAEKQELEAEEA